MERKGVSLIETVIALAVFAIISVSVYQSYSGLIKVFSISRINILLTQIANEEMEIIRNLPYQNVGTVGGVPSGILPQSQVLSKEGFSFDLAVSIRNIDDPFDGTLGGNPNDASPSDYKLAEVTVSCAQCANPKPFTLTGRISPKALENASTNGALFVQVINANGQAVSGASVQVINNTVVPPVNISDSTDSSGFLKIIDVPPAAQSYRIIVSKSGYSGDRTYAISQDMPAPVKPDATVAAQQITQVTFAIDRVSQFNVSSVNDTCGQIGNFTFALSGAKTINSNPQIYKYYATTTTSQTGSAQIPNLEWDTYSLWYDPAGNVGDLAGVMPLPPINLIPNTSQNLIFNVKPSSPDALLVFVKDAATGLPLSGATTTLSKAGYSSTILSGRGSLVDTDWSGQCGGGPGAGHCSLASQNIDTQNPQGEIKLMHADPSTYVPSGWLIGSFDTGSASNFYTISWLPQSQPPQTEPDSVLIQLASSSTTPPGASDVFRGPDGTTGTWYSLSNMNINSIHNGDRYLSYKIYLETASTSYTPDVSDVYLTYASQCIASGQSFFAGLAPASYTLSVKLNGYQNYQAAVNINSAWQMKEVLMQAGVSPPPPPGQGGGL